MWQQGGLAANDGELERGGRTILRALWEEPARFSRNRHYAALQTAEGRAARRDIRVCRSILEALSTVELSAVTVRRVPKGLAVTLSLVGVKASREVVLSEEAFALLLEHPLSARLKTLLPAESLSRPAAR